MGKKRQRRKAMMEKAASGEDISLNKKGKAKKKKQKPPQKMEKPNWALTGLAIAGMVLTAYLSLTAWFGKAPVLCAEGSSCDIVQQSRWGIFLGLPTAFWGFLTYAALGYIGLKVRTIGTHWKSAWTVSLIGLGYSIYLTAISIFSIGATCTYCLVSFFIMAVLFGVVTYQRPGELPDFNFKSWAIQAVIVVIVIVGGMHMHYSGVFDPDAGPEDPYLRGLAEHLSKEKALVYGAFW